MLVMPLSGCPLDEIVTLVVMNRPADDPHAWMKRFEASCLRDVCLKLFDQHPNRIIPLRMDWVAALVRSECPDQVLTGLVLDGCNWGAVAGDILLLLLSLDEHEKSRATRRPQATINRAVFITSQDLGDARLYNGDKAPNSKSAVMKAWSKFKPAAHLWAAYRLCLDDFPEIKIMEGGLHEFLAIAEWIRARSERFLDPDESWRVPSDFFLPSVSLRVPPPTEWVLKKAKEYRAPS